MRRYIKESARKTQRSISMRLDIWDVLKELAIAQERSISQTAEMIILKELKAKKLI